MHQMIWCTSLQPFALGLQGCAADPLCAPITDVLWIDVEVLVVWQVEEGKLSQYRCSLTLWDEAAANAMTVVPFIGKNSWDGLQVLRDDVLENIGPSKLGEQIVILRSVGLQSLKSKWTWHIWNRVSWIRHQEWGDCMQWRLINNEVNYRRETGDRIRHCNEFT